MASRFSRFAFRRHFIQHAGFRLARTIKEDSHSPVAVVDTPVYIIETKTLGNLLVYINLILLLALATVLNSFVEIL